MGNNKKVDTSKVRKANKDAKMYKERAETVDRMLDKFLESLVSIYKRQELEKRMEDLEHNSAVLHELCEKIMRMNSAVLEENKVLKKKPKNCFARALDNIRMRWLGRDGDE